MEYDRGDSFPFDSKPNGMSFGSKSKIKLSPRSYPIHFERKWKWILAGALLSYMVAWHAYTHHHIPLSFCLKNRHIQTSRCNPSKLTIFSKLFRYQLVSYYFHNTLTKFSIYWDGNSRFKRVDLGKGFFIQDLGVTFSTVLPIRQPDILNSLLFII